MQKINQLLIEYLPFYKKLDKKSQDLLSCGAAFKTYEKGEMLLKGGAHCLGVVIVLKGTIKVSFFPGGTREIALYKLLERDMCLFTAACVLKGVDFDVSLEAEEKTEVLFIPPTVWEDVSSSSIDVSNFEKEIMSQRFSDVIWLVEQIVARRMDERIAGLLVTEQMPGGELSLTHDTIAKDLGTAREVVTRILKIFERDGVISQSRGKITILNVNYLESISKNSRR